MHSGGESVTERIGFVRAVLRWQIFITICIADPVREWKIMKDRQFNKVIMRLNAWRILTKKEKIFDCIYVTILFMPITVLLVAMPLFVAFGKLKSWLLISVLSFAVSLTIGLFRRNYTISRFYKIKSIEGKIKIVPVEDLTVLDELYKTSALTFAASPDSKALKFIYNWLNNCNILGEGFLIIYALEGKSLREKYGYEIEEEHQFLCIPLSELNITAENIMQFGNEYPKVGAQYFDKMIDTWVNTF